jgi:hypothetical protein
MTSLDQARQGTGFLIAEYLELDARRTSVDDEYRIHSDQAFGNAAARRRASA